MQEQVLLSLTARQGAEMKKRYNNAHSLLRLG